MAGKRITALDSVFLQTETVDTPMHVAALMQFELPASANENFVADVVARFRACTVFRRPWNRVLEKPRGGKLMPRMRTVHDVDMEYHVRHLSLPRPGGERELGQLISRLHSQPMALRKPLWECHVIEGLSENRFAIYIKLHHALVDGVSGSRMLMRALATDPDAPGQLPFWATGSGAPPKPKNAPPRRRPQLPSPLDLLQAARAAGQTWFGRGDDTQVSLRSAPRSILNGRIAAQRRFATQAVELRRLKAIGKAANASLNDAVLALTGSALRDYLLELNALPSQGLTVSIPVSLREAGDTSTGNAVSMLFATLGTHIADDQSRLEAIKASTQAAKTRLQAMSPTAQKLYPAFMFAPVVAAMTLDVAGRTKPPFNTVVSNVPGGEQERYLYGARLANIYPVSIPMHGMALNVTCYSHAGQLNFGITACRDSVPHVQNIAVNLATAVTRLEAIYCPPPVGKRRKTASN